MRKLVSVTAISVMSTVSTYMRVLLSSQGQSDNSVNRLTIEKKIMQDV